MIPGQPEIASPLLPLYFSPCGQFELSLLSLLNCHCTGMDLVLLEVMTLVLWGNTGK